MPPTHQRRERAGSARRQPDSGTTAFNPENISCLFHVPEFSKPRQASLFKNNTVIQFSNNYDE